MGQEQGKCNKVNVKSSCQMAVSRMNIHKQKKQNEIAKKKQEISNLLKNGNEELAKIKVESVIRDENTVMVYDIISQMVEVCQERADFLIDLKRQKFYVREIPSDMFPHLQTIFYAGPRLDIPELNKFCQLMQKRCTGLGNQLVNVTVKEKLELCLYDDELKTVKLREIASQYKVEYVPKADPFKDLRVDLLPPPTVPSDQQPQLYPPQNQGNIIINPGEPNQVQIQFQPSMGQPMPGYQQQFMPGMQPGLQQGMQPGLQPGMQPGLQPGMQPGLQQGMQPGLQPGMQPGLQQGMQPGLQPGMQPQGLPVQGPYPQIPQIDPNQFKQQDQSPSMSSSFDHQNQQQSQKPGPPGQPPTPM